MFVHSLWSETRVDLSNLADIAMSFFEPTAVIFRSPQSVELLFGGDVERIEQTDQGVSIDEQWQQAAPTDSPRMVRLYEASFATGIASVDPSLNFWLETRIRQLVEEAPPLRLIWNRETPLGWSEWQPSALHLQNPELSTEVVIQGPWGHASADILTGESAKLPEYEIAGVSLADTKGRTMTLYDGGQLWFQQVGPEEVPGLFEAVVSPLLGRD